ncbi:hypothetical protein BDM02DRAFT_3166994 [Thelephora ganbajun]|uniref:Uncharacterized protein n=1 Tax=Thelephora ganbajun TaxID=370292 RepID=A0ACB6ZIM9_THEGA|nr:hypothetical protein BDM02DRAFT_3166994 [Thelephora ganbajun]
MAFPIPSHLPKKQPTDVSSAILSRISNADSRSLNAALAESWITDLDESIRAAKQLIHERIQRDLPSFRSQLVAAESIRSRLHTLKDNTDMLSDAISNPESGLTPNLIRTLTRHSELAQSTLDAEAKHRNLQYASQLRSEFRSFSHLVYNGELPEAVRSSSQLSILLEQAPIPLRDATLTGALRRKHRSLRDRVEELLNDAYSHSIVLTPTACGIRPHVQVQKSSKSVSLSEILSSLSPNSLSECLTMLRRDITANFIEFVLIQPLSITLVQSADALSASIEYRLELFPVPPNSATLVSRLDNLSGILQFLNAHLFGAIPSSQRASFLKSFSKPLTSGIFNHLLIPGLPTSLSGLPKYLDLLERAVKFESEDLTRILFSPTSSTDTEICPENEIKGWAEGIISHYQKNRRVGILDQARRMFTDVPSDWHETFQVEWTYASAATASSVNGSALPELTVAPEPSPTVDHPPVPTTNGINGASRDIQIEQVNEGWGFDDDDGGAGEDTPPDEEAKESPSGDTSSSPTDPGGYSADEVDDDAWGWNDEEAPEPTPVPKPEAPIQPKENGDGGADSSAAGDDPLWDAWDDTPPSPQTMKAVPKPATKLEKFSSKGKRSAKPPKIITQPPEPEPIPVPTHTTTRANPDRFPTSASPTSLPSSWSSSISTPSQQFQSIPPTPASITTLQKVPKEFYSVSSGMQDIVELVESVMLESSEFSRSTLLAAYLPAHNSASSASSTSGGTPGSVILNTVPSILDLFRALYPMTLQLELESGNVQKGARKSVTSEGIIKKTIQFSNDCLYLEERIRELVPASSSGSSKTSATVPPDVWTIDCGLRGKVEEAGRRVKVYGDSWFAGTIERQLNEIDEILDVTEGFVDTNDQDRFDTCEEAVNAVVKKVKRVWQVWKGILPSRRHLTAIGGIVDAVLSRMLEDITKLPDITADESHRLSELCRMLNALEGLFVEGPEKTSAVVAYVPSWLKFSYLSEVLEASMADVTYLFEEGALVDFEIDELVKLVTALFSDTPLRAETIQKLQIEHGIRGGR